MYPGGQRAHQADGRENNMKISKVLEALDMVNEYINMLDEQGALSLDEARELEEADDIIRTFLLDKMEER